MGADQSVRTFYSKVYKVKLVGVIKRKAVDKRITIQSVLEICKQRIKLHLLIFKIFFNSSNQNNYYFQALKLAVIKMLFKAVKPIKVYLLFIQTGTVKYDAKCFQVSQQHFKRFYELLMDRLNIIHYTSLLNIQDHIKHYLCKVQVLISM